MFSLKDKMLAGVALVFLLSLLYSILRYIIFKGVGWVDFPIYVLNKALSLGMVILFALTHYLRNRAPGNAAAVIQGFAVLFTVLHVLLSLLVFSPHYFPDFFDGGRLSLVGNLSMFFGVLAIGVLLALTENKSFKELNAIVGSRKSMASILFLVISMHVLVMGFDVWIKPSAWPGSLPPITLVAFIVLATTVFLIRRRKS
ncbi:hypothetical protein [Haliea atlantica]